MKTKSKLFILTSLLTVAMIAAGCSGGTKAATSSNPPATSTPPATSSQPPASTTTPPTSATGKTLPAVGIAISYHGVGTGYAGNCVTCHGANGAPANQFPLPPTWNGSANTPGTYTVAAGSPADHTGRTADQCLTCHAVAGATTTPATTTATPTTTTPGTTTPTMTGSTPPAATTSFLVATSGMFPSTITIHVGTEVTWTDQLESDATIISSDGTFGGTAPRGGTYKYTFTKPGTYSFYISEEPDLKGTVIVTA